MPLPVFYLMIELTLRKKYQIEVYDNVADYLIQPITKLYDRLASIKRDVFPDDYRIVFYVQAPLKQDFLNYLQKTLTELDIPNFFVLVVSNQPTIQSQLLEAFNRYSSDSAPIAYLYHNAPVVPLPIEKTNFSIPDSICVNPWINLEITNTGNFRPCCEYAGVIPDITIESTSIIDAYNTSYMKNIRLDFLRGTTPSGCVGCVKQESLGKKSKRIRDNFVYRDYLGNIDWNANLTQLVSLDIKLGSTCNLSCRICGPVNSSAWAQEVKTHDLNNKYNITSLIKADWIKDTESHFWNNLREITKSLRYIQFTGGEPLLSKQHVYILEHLIDAGVADQISLHYNTNGTIFPDQLISIWDQFKHVGISFSIDNIGKKFEYERYGESWEVVESNIDRFLKLNLNRMSLDIYCTLSALNIADAYSLYQFGKLKKLPVEYNMLKFPSELSIDILTKQAKQYIISTLTNNNDKEFIKKINPIINRLKQESPGVLLDKFWATINLIDGIRDQNFSDYYPDLYKLLKE